MGTCLISDAAFDESEMGKNIKSPDTCGSPKSRAAILGRLPAEGIALL
jgi:hypothetical protein